MMWLITVHEIYTVWNNNNDDDEENNGTPGQVPAVSSWWVNTVSKRQKFRSNAATNCEHSLVRLRGSIISLLSTHTTALLASSPSLLGSAITISTKSLRRLQSRVLKHYFPQTRYPHWHQTNRSKTFCNNIYLCWNYRVFPFRDLTPLAAS